MFNRDRVPEMLKFLPLSHEIRQKEPTRVFDVLIIVDCNTMERVGSDRLFSKKVAIIDHHLSDSGFGDIKWIVPNSSSTGELIYKFLLSVDVDIDKNIATNLYSAIITDTGSFRYPGTTPDTLRTAAALMERGIDIAQINKELFESLSFSRMKLLGHVLSGLERRGEITWFVITKKLLDEVGATVEDTEDLVNYARMIKGVEVSIMFREMDNNSYKISLRSKEKVNVAEIAESFGGGGHYNASGCVVKGTLDEVREKVLGAVEYAIKGSHHMLR